MVNISQTFGNLFPNGNFLGPQTLSELHAWQEILLVHKGLVLIAREGTNHLRGSTPLVTGKNNYFVSQKMFLVAKQNEISFLWQKYSICDVHIKLLVIGGTFPVTLWNIHMRQEKNHVTGRIQKDICHRKIFHCERKNVSCDRKFISCDRNKKEHLVSQYNFPVN